MRIHVGSLNPNKIGAVQDVLATYDAFTGAEIVGIDVPSGVADQPMDLAETVRGAIQRAKAVIEGADFGIGIEGGVMDVPGAGSMNIQVCAVFDGTAMYHGISSAFGLPTDLIDLMKQKSIELDAAVHELGYSTNARVGKEGGLIAVLSGGRVTRRDLCRQAVSMAMIHVGRS